MAQTQHPNVEMIETLLACPDLAAALKGRDHLRVAATQEAGPLAGSFRLHGMDVELGGPVVADNADKAFHITRILPAEDGRIRLDFTLPEKEISGEALFDRNGRMQLTECTRG